MRFTLALLAAAAATVMADGPISQISDGQIQNPTTPIVVYSTQSPAPYPAGNSSSVAAVGTGYTSAVPTGPYSNSTASAGSSSAAASPTSSTPAATSSTAAESTGGAVALQAGGFGLAAAIAALIIA